MAVAVGGADIMHLACTDCRDYRFKNLASLFHVKFFFTKGDILPLASKDSIILTIILLLLLSVILLYTSQCICRLCVCLCEGMYTLDRERGNVPCLFYATFNNKIFVYHNIHMAQIGTSNLLNTIQQMMSSESNSRVGCGTLLLLRRFQFSLVVNVYVVVLFA
jgi:hypothetical protein